MALIVEDGTVVADADSFVSLAEANAYFTSYGGSSAWTDADDADKESALRRATLWLSTYFRWKGSPISGRSQALAWPRSGVTDCEGETVASDEVPIEVKRATYAAALYELSNVRGLTPEVVPWQQAKRQKVGPIEVEFRDLRETRPGESTRIDDSRIILAQVEDQLRCLVNRRTLEPGPIVA